MLLWTALLCSSAPAAPPSRIVVLQWPDTDADHHDEKLQKHVRDRVGGELRFVPGTDLYQGGRVRLAEPADAQVGRLTPEAARAATERVAEIRQLSWDAIPREGWLAIADELRALHDSIGFLDDATLRPLHFALAVELGRAAENLSEGKPLTPWFDQVGNEIVNVHWLRAASLADQDPTLLASVTSTDVRQGLEVYRGLLEGKSLGSFTVTFDLDGRFSPRDFAAENRVMIDGLEQVITDPHGRLRLSPVVHDISIRHEDGWGLSARTDTMALGEPALHHTFAVHDLAFQRTSFDLTDHLMEHPGEGTPPLPDRHRRHLAAYQALHPEAPIYVVVPYAGRTQRVSVWIWRWHDEDHLLHRMAGG